MEEKSHEDFTISVNISKSIGFPGETMTKIIEISANFY